MQPSVYEVYCAMKKEGNHTIIFEGAQAIVGAMSHHFHALHITGIINLKNLAFERDPWRHEIFRLFIITDREDQISFFNQSGIAFYQSCISQ